MSEILVEESAASPSPPPTTILLVSVPDPFEQDVYKLDVYYAVFTVQLSDREKTLVRACTTEPYLRVGTAEISNFSQLALGLMIFERFGNRTVWTHKSLETRKRGASEPYTNDELNTKQCLDRVWADMPPHDVFISAHNIVQARIEEDDWRHMFSDILSSWLEEPHYIHQELALNDPNKVAFAQKVAALHVDDFGWGEPDDESDFGDDDGD